MKKPPRTPPPTTPPAPIAYAGMNLPAHVLKSLADRSIIETTPVQGAVIQHLLPMGSEGFGDLLAQARTGSGKTLAFLLPLVAAREGGALRRAWIVCPTRELAQQVAREAVLLVGESAVATLVGGVAFGPQLRDLSGRPALVVGTPGRMADHLRQGSLEEGADVLVLDEADRMFDLGFREELEQLVGGSSEDAARWLFSATFDRHVTHAVGAWLRDPHEIRLDEGQSSAHVPHRMVVASAPQRHEALARLVDFLEPQRALTFVRTRLEVEEAVQSLRRHGHRAEGLSGDLGQDARERAMARFREGAVPLLVATDIAARGIDVPGVTHVFNLGLPADPSNFAHRLGRTARAGAEGEAWSLVTFAERTRLASLCRDLGARPETRTLPTAAEVVDRRRERLANKTAESLGEGLELPHAFAELAREHGVEAVLAAIVHRLVPDPPPEEPAAASSRSSRNATSTRDPASAWTGFGVGHIDGVQVRGVVAWLCDTAGIQGTDLGRIEVLPRVTLVASTEEAAAQLRGARLTWQRRRVRSWEAEPPRQRMRKPRT